MDDIDNKIYDYYTANFSHLPFDKQFHFASRLYLWNQDDFAGRQLPILKDSFTCSGDAAAALKKIYDDSLTSPVHGSKNAAELRKPYFEKYPTLKRNVLLLFRTAFLHHIYGFDVRDVLFKLVPQSDFETMATELLKDTQATAFLSTHAINFLYLYSRVIAKDTALFDPRAFLNVGKDAYNLNDPIHLQLLIYLYTHCIIGESLFYYRSLPQNTLAIYKEMSEQLEALLDDHFEDINLDNKFEHLVCCKLTGMHSRHADAIYHEASLSLSPDGDFLVDTLNKNPQRDNNTLEKSEHRNVLFLMSRRDFKPRSL